MLSAFFNHLAKLKRYRDIIFYRILAQLKGEARQYYLGYIWFALEPMLTTGIFFLVFGFLLGARSPEYLWLLIISTITWQWFEAAVNDGMMGIKSKLHILLQIPLPKQIFPLVGVGAATWRFLCVLCVLLAANIIFGKGISLTWLALPVVMLLELFLIIGVAWLLAVAVSYLEDIQKITQAMMRIFFYLSGVFFAVDKVPVDLRLAFYANPMAILLQSYRDILIYQCWPDFSLLSYAALCGVVMMALGYWVCKNTDKKLMKEVVA